MPGRNAPIPSSKVSPHQLDAVLERIRRARNFDFRNYKRATLFRRLDRRMTERGCKSVADYLDLLDHEPDEYDALISRMLIKATSFFRDADIWAALEKKIVPALVKARQRDADELRVWCAGCATGEEAFSIAMLLAEATRNSNRLQVKVFGTDGDEAAIAYARRGIYTADQMKPVPQHLRHKYFVQSAAGFAVRKELRRYVVFGVNNLISDAPISRLDLIMCRNVFIYLDGQIQKRVLGRFHYALKQEGVLVLGRSELIPVAGRIFEPMDLPKRIYRKDPRKDPPLASVDADGRPIGDGSEELDADAQALGLRQLQRDALNALTVPALVVSLDGKVVHWNQAASRLWGRGDHDVLGRKLHALALAGLMGEEVSDRAKLVRSGRSDKESVEVTVGRGKTASLLVRIDLAPVRDATRAVYGVLYVVQDIGNVKKLEAELRAANDELRRVNEKLLSSNEELQSFNEELETTNEELQSSNEELQTTNEELQSTNEELETTNEELQSTNAELDATNRELADRTEEMNQLAFYQRATLRSLSAAVVVVDAAGRITSWNLAAERLLGVLEREAVGQVFWTLHVPSLPRAQIAKFRRAFAERRSMRVNDLSYTLPTGGTGSANVSAVSLVDGNSDLGGLIIFEDTTRFMVQGKELEAAKAAVNELERGVKGEAAPKRQRKK